MTEQINQLIEQIKHNLTTYQSQLNQIEIESNKETERIIAAIRAEEAEIKDLLDEYRHLKQEDELEAFKSSFNYLVDFKQNLLSKIKSGVTTINIEQVPTISIQKPNNVRDLSILTKIGEETPKKSNTENTEDTEDTENIEYDSHEGIEKEPVVTDERGPIITELIEFIDQTTAQDLVKLYPANVSRIVPGFNVNDSLIKDKLLQHYYQRNKNSYNALVKLYQKPELKTSITIPDIQSLAAKDRKYHEFLTKYYPNALPFFWYLVNREPDSIRYVVMEFAVDHIIQTNTLDTNNNSNELSISLKELFSMANGISLTDYLRDIFVCFHPQRVSSQNNSKNRYFDYIDTIIRKEATLEHSNVLQLWNYMNKVGYHTVASDDFFLAIANGNQQNGNGINLASTSQHEAL
jgi:hypothetical protein